MNKISRAEKAGISLGKNIVEVANLMYQNNTALNFLKGVSKVLFNEFTERYSDKLSIKFQKKNNNV